MNNKILSENYQNQNENYEETRCPIYFEDHSYGGGITQIENLINYDFGFAIRTTFINNRPYFCAVDICKGLALNTKDTSKFTMLAVNDVLVYYNMDQQNNSEKVAHRIQFGEPKNSVFAGPEIELYYYLNINIENTNQYGAQFVQERRTLFISEPVLYMLTFRSTKREAVAFKAWLSVEILPKLRYLGRERALNALQAEINNKVEEDNKLLWDEFKELKSEMTNRFDSQAEFNNQEIDYIANRFNNLDAKINNVGYMTNYIVDLNKTNLGSTQNVANGLYTIFGV